MAVLMVMNSYPLIGVSGSIDAKETEHFLLRNYFTVLISAGAIPVMLSPDMDEDQMDHCLSRLDGLFLAGGNDLAPELFGAQPVEALGEVNPLRDRLEMQLIPKAFSIGMPVVGVCRGMQSMNVAMGGTLWQDLPSQYRTPQGQPPIAHRQTRPGQYSSHSINIRKDSMLFSLLASEEIQVNSFHHQAVRDLAPALLASAFSPDGVIEAIEHADHPFFLGVQWHPERYDSRAPHAASLFRGFVSAAEKYIREKNSFSA